VKRTRKTLVNSMSSIGLTGALTGILAAALAASMTACMVEVDGLDVDTEATEIEIAADRPAEILRAQRPVAGQYIVVLRDDLLTTAGEPVASVAQSMARSSAGRVLATYEHSLRGFAARMSETRAKALLSDPRVAYIVEDSMVEISATQSGATWGLDRTDQRERPLNGNYSYHAGGAGVHAYIIDTGIRLTHQELSGRVGAGFDAVTSGGSAGDCNGHGTHVAGTVGGSTYGIAKSVILHPVRVLDCGGSGTTSGVIAGVDWVAANHVKPAVANMSLGGGANQALDDAVARAVAAGVTMVVAAGNSNADACSFSPARASSALTVGATDSSDTRSSFSNFGSCVDIFAPGSGITSAYHSSDSATAVLSGTSMASPHAAGVAALYLQNNPFASPAQVMDRLISSSIANFVGNAGTNSPNRLLHNGLSNISLRTATGHFLVSENGGGSYVASDRTGIGNWERFDLADLNGADLRHGDLINLRVNNGSYMVAEGSGGGVVNANRTVASSWETFRVLNLDGWSDFLSGDRVALQAANGQFVVAEGGGGRSGSGSVNANRGAIGAWETFVITVH
jgi:subtilisin family serine protease